MTVQILKRCFDAKEKARTLVEEQGVDVALSTAVIEVQNAHRMQDNLSLSYWREVRREICGRFQHEVIVTY